MDSNKNADEWGHGFLTIFLMCPVFRGSGYQSQLRESYMKNKQVYLFPFEKLKKKP